MIDDLDCVTDRTDIKGLQTPPPSLDQEVSGMLEVKILLLTTRLNELKGSELIRIGINGQEPKPRIYHGNEVSFKRLIVIPVDGGLPIKIKYQDITYFSIYEEKRVV